MLSSLQENRINVINCEPYVLWICLICTCIGSIIVGIYTPNNLLYSYRLRNDHFSTGCIIMRAIGTVYCLFCYERTVLKSKNFIRCELEFLDPEELQIVTILAFKRLLHR